MTKITILGSGISGLSLGWFLKQLHGDDIDLQILEKAPRPGGLICSLQKDGFLFELGPHSIRFSGSGEETLNLIQELGLQKELIQADPSSNIRYLYMQNQLQQVPNSLKSMLFSPVAKGLASGFFRDLFAPASINEDESIEEFIKRRFGLQVANNLMDPFISGIYAGDIQKLSIRACFPFLHEWEKKYGSIIKGAFKSRGKKQNAKTGIFSLKMGLQQMITLLAERLQEHLHLSSEIKAISPEKKGALLTLADGSNIFTDHLYSTLPPASLLALFEGPFPELGRLLAEIPSAPIAVVNLGYRCKALNKKGFGYLIPSKENEKILGVIWSSLVFPQQNQQPEETRLTVMIGGARMNTFLEYAESDFLDIALDALERHLGIIKEPDCSHVTIHQKAIPQYLVGHPLRLQAIEAFLVRHLPYLTFHGNGFYGISINDCIQRSKHLSKQSSRVYKKISSL